MTSKILFIVFVTCVISVFCDRPDHGEKDFNKIVGVSYASGWFPEDPVNIADLNTEFDDYNSYLPVIGRRLELYYSTNKDSEGENFDISSICIDAFFNYKDSTFSFNPVNDYPYYSYYLLPRVNTGFNELGPFGFNTDSLTERGIWIFLYANDSLGNYNVQYAYTCPSDWGHWDSQRRIFGPLEAKVFNTASDDYYPAINKEQDKFYFSSNRENDYDIYRVDISSDSIIDWLDNGKDIPEICENLSSPYDDKCPYINGNLMVYASDSRSGYGGYDLWYSVFENGEWSVPNNFGPRINTRYDEYRPAIESFPDSENDLMIFSSDRPGGKGGFDLYYAGISKMIE
jgi:hypothetical protein